MAGRGARGRERKLPVKQFVILAMVRFSEPIASTSVYPYLPAMIASFRGVKPADVGFWTGLAGAIFSMAQCLTAIAWGRASDKYGRKPVLLAGLFNTMITSLLWGVSTSMPMALFSRALSGAGNGNVGILRTMVAELCPWKELQPRAFSIMPIVYSVGSIIGPTLGGAMANPLGRQPNDDPKLSSNLLWKFPYLLPNLVSALFFLFSIFTGWLFLRETLANRKNNQDIGLMVGEKMIGLIRSPYKTIMSSISGHEAKYTAIPSTPRRSSGKDEEIALKKLNVVEKQPTYSEVLTKQTILYLISYTILSMHNAAFDQMLPVFMHQARMGSEVQETQLPLRFNKGFEMDSSRIGMLFTVNGVVGTVFQFFLFPRITRRFGVLNVLRFTLHGLPFVYFITPFAVILPNTFLAQTALMLVWSAKTSLAIFVFPCCTILLTNSATSLRVLGTVNGITTSLGAIGRAIGPSICGLIFTWGIHTNYMIAPFWFLALLGILAWPPLWMSVEGNGFGDDDEETDSEGGVEDDEADDEGDGTDPSKLLNSSKSEKHKTARRSADFHETALESDYDSADDDDDETSKFLKPSSRIRKSRNGARGPIPKRRRRSGTPLGDTVGFRRLSSNLGVTRSGFGSGSELGT